MNAQVFEDFYREHYGSILATAHLRLGDYADAQDITAEVFRVVWQRYQNGSSPALPSAYQTLRNLTGNEYRRRRRGRSLVEKLTAVTDHRAEEDIPADIDVIRVIGQLNEADRELLYLAYWADIELKDIAEILGIGASALRMRLKRLRGQLADQLGEPQGHQNSEEAPHERY